MGDVITIGSGGIGAGDRIEPGVQLAESGRVAYMGFDCLAERTLALAQIRREADPEAGQDERMAQFISAYAPFIGRGGRMIGNFGAANPDAAVRDAVAALRAAGLAGTKVGVIRGDDVREALFKLDPELPERGCRLSDVAPQVVSAHAYIGAEGVVELLEQDAAVVIGGRLADPSVWVGAICHELGWALDDWDRVARATLVGHLLEGGLGRAPGPDLSLPTGYPYATVSEQETVVSKLEGTGGPIDLKAARSGLSHEIHDPTRYLTPDVTADLSQVWFEELGPNTIRAHGVRGTARPESCRVLVGLDLGWKVVGEVSFGGPRCVERAEEVAGSVGRLLDRIEGIAARRVEIHGVNAVFGDAYKGGYPADCRLRVASRCTTKQAVDEVSAIYWQLYGNGGGGVTRQVDRMIGVTPAIVPKDITTIETEVVTA